jgi:hypothetical protein
LGRCIIFSLAILLARVSNNQIKDLTLKGAKP